jgi:uncharacterized protein (TIGR03435 family)
LENARVRKTTARAEALQRVAGARLDVLVSVELAPLSKVPFRMDRPVLDMTGLEGRYDFEVRIAPDALAMKHAFEGMLKGDADGPSLIDLIQEQLGPRFTTEQHPVDVLTVDGADRTPTAN